MPAVSSSPTRVEGGGDERALLLGDQSHPGQHVDVRPGAGEVVGGQAGVERQALAEGQQLLGRPLSEAALPQRPALALRPGFRLTGGSVMAGPRRPWRRAHVSTDRPHSRTKPAAS